eukprot:5292399-Prymnesium_polylepis.1
MTHSAVKAVIEQDRTRLEGWFNKIPLDETGKVTTPARSGSPLADDVTQPQWVTMLKSLNVLGTFTCIRGSDVVGDDRIGT